MTPVRTEETVGIYGAPKGMEDVVSGLPYWRETDPETGLPLIRSVWTLDADEKEAIALGGNILLGIVGEPIPPVQIQVLSPIDVPAYGMPAIDPLYVPEETPVAAEVPGGFEKAVAWYDLQGDVGAAVGWIALLILGLVVLAILSVGFFLGRVTA